jgi:hypothetical protein
VACDPPVEISPPSWPKTIPAGSKSVTEVVVGTPRSGVTGLYWGVFDEVAVTLSSVFGSMPARTSLLRVPPATLVS